LRSFRFTVAGVLDLLDFGVTTSLEILVVLLLLRMVLRVRWLSVVAAVALLAAVFAAPSVMLAAHAFEISLALAVLLRFGLLSMMSGVFVFVLSGNYLISLDPGSSFATCSYLALTIVVAIAVYGYRRAVVRDPFLPAPYPDSSRPALSRAVQ
jgi:hypothetical protein